MTPGLIDPDARREFASKGFVVVSLLSADEAVAALHRVFAAQDGSAFSRSDGGRIGFQFHASALEDDAGYRRRMHDLTIALIGSPLDRHVSGYEVLLAGIFVKTAKSPKLPLHLDWSMRHPPRSIGLNVWCPLVDVDEHNGALRLLSGSERLVDHVAGPRVDLFCGPYLDDLERCATTVTLRAGQAVIYDSTMLHGSFANDSDSARPVLTMNYLPRGTQPVFYRPDPPTRPARFEIFDMRDGGYLEHGAADLYAGTIRRPSLGFVPNRNVRLSAAEFNRRLARRQGRASGRGLRDWFRSLEISRLWTSAASR